MNDVADAKTTLRSQAKNARRNMSPEDREIASLVIAESVIRESFFRRTRFIASYLPTADEVNTWPLIERAWRMKKRIFAPVVEKNQSLRFREIGPNCEFRTNRFGIQEPASGEFVAANRLDIVFTPLVAFDAQCNRIGMGGGYYDRTFAFQKSRGAFIKPKLAGLAFECQRVEQITASPWDIQLFQIFTESGKTC